MRNINLSKARKIKNDEFYTFYEDIEKEIKEYKDYLENKIVYCNCDNPKYSQFWKYFKDNFKELKIKKLISTYLSKEAYKTVYNGEDIVRTKLIGNGSFESDECLSILKESDVVITNPPFSIFGKYVSTLTSNDKKFLIVGNKNAVFYKDVFPHLKNNQMKLGFHNITKFYQEDKTIKKFGNIGWFTNIISNKQKKTLLLTEEYYSKGKPKDSSLKKYKKYYNFNAINVDRLSDIPKDYYGIMGVPITYFDYHDEEMFEIIGTDGNIFGAEIGIEPVGNDWIKTYFENGKTGHLSASMRVLVLLENGKASQKFKRILIKSKSV